MLGLISITKGTRRRPERISRFTAASGRPRKVATSGSVAAFAKEVSASCCRLEDLDVELSDDRRGSCFTGLV